MKLRCGTTKTDADTLASTPTPITSPDIITDTTVSQVPAMGSDWE